MSAQSQARTCHAEASVDLPLEPVAAWEVVVDWERQSRWMLFTRVWPTSQQGQGLGGGVAARTSVGGLGFTDDMVITLWDPPRECTVKHLGTVVRGTGTFAVQPSPADSRSTDTRSTGTSSTDSSSGGSRFVWSEDVVPPFGRVGRAAWPLVRPGFELMMRISLRRLARDVAGGAR